MSLDDKWIKMAACAAALAVAVAASGATPVTSGPGTTAPAASAPATSSGTGPGVSAKADYSSPVAAVETMLTAIEHGDFATARGALEIPAAHADEVGALMDTMEATSKLQRAASARFLAAGDKAFGTPTAVTLSAQLKQVATAEVVIRNNDATVMLPADGALNTKGGEIALKKIGSDWKIDGASFFKLESDAAATATRVALAKKVTEISQAMSKEIAAGKYFSASDAYVEYWNRCQAAAK